MAATNDSQQNKTNEKTVKQEQGMTSTIVIFAIVLVLIVGVFFVLRNMYPSYMFNQGKKALEAGQYEKALKTFINVANAKPYDNEPIYYEVLALSKMPPTYETQKLLYDIAQLEDCDEASELADNILMNMRKDLDKQIGPNYADNILFDDQLIRWNNSKPITFSISADSSVPSESINAVKDAVYAWEGVSNGTIKLNETTDANANIKIKFTDDISIKDKFDPKRIGKTLPIFKDEVLQSMEVYIKKTDVSGENLNANKVYNVALHEMGHALGLGGHSADSNDVMYYTFDSVSVPAERRNITQRDINTLLFLYKMIPDIIDKPIAPSEYANLYYHDMITGYPGENFELEIQRLISQLKANGNDIVAWVDLAINYGLKRQYARSNYILTQALPLVQTDLRNQFVILYNLAVNYYKLREYKLAEKHLNLAKTINDDKDTQILEAFIDVRLNRLDIALDKLKILVRTYPEDIEPALKLSYVYYLKKDRKMEKETIDNLIKRNPKALRDRRVYKYNVRKQKEVFKK